MKERQYQSYNDKQAKGYNNLNHSALNYVQSAIERTADSSSDATQNLVNNIMNKQKSNG
jgi:hypothetical protein